MGALKLILIKCLQLSDNINYFIFFSHIVWGEPVLLETVGNKKVFLLIVKKKINFLIYFHCS